MLHPVSRQLTTHSDTYSFQVYHTNTNDKLVELQINPYDNIEFIKFGQVRYQVPENTGVININVNLDPISPGCHYTELHLHYKPTYLDMLTPEVWYKGYYYPLCDCCIEDVELPCREWDKNDERYEITREYKRYLVQIPEIRAEFEGGNDDPSPAYSPTW